MKRAWMLFLSYVVWLSIQLQEAFFFVSVVNFPYLVALLYEH